MPPKKSNGKAREEQLQRIAFDPWEVLKKYRPVKLANEASIEIHKERFKEIDGDEKRDLSTTGLVKDYLQILEAAGFNFAGTQLESHARTMRRTQEMLKAIEWTVDLVRNSANGGVFYSLLYHTYLSLPASEAPETIAEVLARMGKDGYETNERAYYRLREQAVEAFGDALFMYGGS